MVENDSADWNAVTRGSLLFFEEPPANVAETAQVYAMKAATPAAGMVLTDANGRSFTTKVGSASSTSSALYGDVTTATIITADEASSSNVTLDTALTVAASSHVNGLSDSAVVSSVGDATTTIGQRFSFTGLDAAT